MRCSELPAASRRWARKGGDNSSATSSSPTSTAPADDSPSGGRRRSRRPSPTASPARPGGSSAAVASLSMIWPALASTSISAHRLAAGPLMTSSRWICGSPTRKKSNRPLCTPTDMRRLTPPADELVRPTVRSSLRMSAEARTARTACSSPVKRSSTASPPHFTRSPPSRRACASNAPKVASRMSLSSSEPTVPCRVSRLASAVKPEMSTNARVPSTLRCRWSGSPTSHSAATSGT